MTEFTTEAQIEAIVDTVIRNLGLRLVIARGSGVDIEAMRDSIIQTVIRGPRHKEGVLSTMEKAFERGLQSGKRR